MYLAHTKETNTSQQKMFHLLPQYVIRLTYLRLVDLIYRQNPTENSNQVQVDNFHYHLKSHRS